MTMSRLIVCRKCILKGLEGMPNCQRIGYRQANFHITRGSFKPRTICEDGPAFTTRLALPIDYDNVADFMTDIYYKGEPTVRNIGCAPVTAPPVWRENMYDQVKMGLSIVAENRDHCLIGAALNTVVYPWEAAAIEQCAKCVDSGPIKEVLHFFGYIAYQPRIFERFCVSRMFEVTSLAVDEDYRSMGVAKRLITESWYLARDCDYKLFHMCCTNRHCMQICSNFGWQEVWNIPFDQYVRNGEVIFKNVQEPNNICRVFIDWLKDCKTYCQPSKKCTKILPPPPQQ
nr:dopamine N-acetyltransferase-like [Megalopta genalis]